MARDIKIQDYSYHLPTDKIASKPLAERSESKLLVYKDGMIKDHSFNSISSLLPSNSTLVFNNTKVVCARILFENNPPSNKSVEIFVLEPAKGISVETAMQQKNKSTWNCLIGNNRYFTSESLVKSIRINDISYELKARRLGKHLDGFEVEFEWNGDISFAEILNLAGIIPLPPYLKRIPDENDKTRYQTVYAKQEGSVAAPTAGLHFTEAILDDIKKNNISTEFVLLHVGAGTFKSVKSESMKDHAMHSEEIVVTKTTLRGLINNHENLIAVGTTSLRTLESLFWIGLKLSKNIHEIELFQWDAYDLEIPKEFTYKDALQTIINYLETNNQESIRTKTQLLIAPGYKIRSVKGLVTNFHQPNSTLLLLVAALVGHDWKKIYDHALNNNYRFLSYGDSSLLLV